MVCIFSTNSDPYFNLAAEEYLLKNRDDDVFMIWKSNPAVVAGKHQNILSEINYHYVCRNNITVARRLTGGGTVFHDEGNINFSFIRNGEAGKLVNFTAFINPVIQFLASVGIEANQGSKHEILVNGLKISGNAEHVYKNRTLHHGTLLYNANLEVLHAAINRKSGIYTDKAVQSNRSSVINLADLLPNDITCDRFMHSFFEFIREKSGGKVVEPDEQYVGAVEELTRQKYATWEWIYGWSPDYHFTNSISLGDGQLTIELRTHRGLILECAIGFTGSDEKGSLLQQALKGQLHREDVIKKALLEAGFERSTDEWEKLVFAFF